MKFYVGQLVVHTRPVTDKQIALLSYLQAKIPEQKGPAKPLSLLDMNRYPLGKHLSISGGSNTRSASEYCAA